MENNKQCLIKIVAEYVRCLDGYRKETANILLEVLEESNLTHMKASDVHVLIEAKMLDKHRLSDVNKMSWTMYNKLNEPKLSEYEKAQLAARQSTRKPLKACLVSPDD